MELKKIPLLFNNKNNQPKLKLKISSRKSVLLPFRKKNVNILDENIKEQNENTENENNNNNEENDKKSDRKKRKIKSLINESKLSLKNILNNESNNKEYIYTILEKNPKNRKEKDIINVADYLSKNYQYFQNIKGDSKLKVENLAKIARIKICYPGESIIRYGEIGDKFYAVMEGKIQIYKPMYEGVQMTPNEFIKYMNNIQLIEKDEDKYSRLKEFNKNKNFDLDKYINYAPNTNIMNTKRDVFIEKLELMGSYGEGFSFGELSLIRNEKRNATIKCSNEDNNKYTVLLSIGKESYNRALKEYQEKKLLKDIENFIKTYPFCKNFTKENMISLFNCLNKINLEKGEYLFHQNDEDTNLYFITNGKFEVYTEISLNWLNKFMEYTINIKDNILGHLYMQRPKKYSDVTDIIKIIKQKKMKSPMIFHELDLWEKVQKKINENNLMGLKFDEEKVNDDKNVYKIKVQYIDKPELLGIENSFEFKNKFYTVKCLEDNGEIKYIKINDFLKIIMNMKLKDFNYLIDIVLEKKNIFAKQIINSMKTIEYKIISNLEMKYELLLNSNNKFPKEVEKNGNEEDNNKICSLIKFKGYKSGLSDILDEDTNILDKKPSDIIKSFLYKHKEPSKNAIKLNKKRELIDFVFSNKTKKIKNEKDIYKNNEENLFKLKTIMKNNNNCSSNIKKFNSTQSNISDFLLSNNSINNISAIKSNSNCNSIKNDNSIFNNSSTHEQKFQNSFLINSYFIYKKQKLLNINKNQIKVSNQSNYLTYVNSKLNGNKNNHKLLKSMNNIDDNEKSKLIKSAILNKKLFNDSNQYYNFISNKKQKINNYDSIIKDKSNSNKSFLNMSNIRANKLQKMKIDEKEKMSKSSSEYFNRKNIFGTVDKNKKEFYLSVEFSHKIVNINKHIDKNLLNHYFPMIHNK
mgnify:CR=1 FL=1